jgi:hypothetical protein
MKGRSAIDLFRKAAAAACEDLKAQIRAVTENTRETELSLQIQGLRAASTTRLSDFDQQMKKSAESLRARIEEQLAIDSASLHEIETVGDSVEYSRNKETVESILAQVQSDCQKEMDRIGVEAERKAEKSRRAHGFAVGALTHRIQEAQNQRRELQDKQERERAECHQKHRADLEAKAEEHLRNNSGYFADAELKKNEIREKIAELSKHVIDFEIRCLLPQQRETERRTIDAVFGKVRNADKRAEVEFEKFFAVIREAPNRLPAVELPETSAPSPRPSTKSARSARSANNSTPRGSRRDSTLLVTPTELKSRKQSPLVTPLFL